MKISAKEIVKPTLTLVIICAVTTALLACTNELTKEPIAANEAESKSESMYSVVPSTVTDFEEVDIGDSYSTAECYAALDENGDTTAYAIATQTTGYGGTIKVMTGIDAQSGEVLSVNVYDNSDETPGLGGNTSNEEFTAQFAGAYSGSGFAVSKDADKYPDNTAVDAVTGATISSRAVVTAVNEAVEIYESIGGAE